MSSKTKPKVKPVCDECGDEIIVDAWAQWDFEGQRWELKTSMDSGWCNTCDSDIRYRYSWKEVMDREIDRVTGETICKTCGKIVVQIAKNLWCDCGIDIDETD